MSENQTICSKCHRPNNLGNSPNAGECHDTNEDEPTLCSAYAKVFQKESEIQLLKSQLEILRDIVRNKH